MDRYYRRLALPMISMDAIGMDLSGQDRQNTKAERDRQNGIGRTGRPDQEWQNRTGRTGQTERDRQNWTGRTGGRTGQADQDRSYVYIYSRTG